MPRLTVMKLTSKTDKLLRTGRILIIIAIAGLVFASIYSAQKIKQITANVRITNDRLRLVEEVLIHSMNNTSAARGYALSGDSSFLKTIRSNEETLKTDIAGLRDVYKTDTAMQNSIDSLHKSVIGKILLSDSVVKIRDTGGLDAVARFINAPGKTRYMESISQIITRMEDRERVHLREYNESRDDFFQLLNNLLLGTIILIMIFTSLVMWLAMGELKNRRATLTLLENYNNRLQHEVEEETRKRLQVFERITDAFVAIDRNWCYTYMNKKAGEIFQRDPQKMIGRHIWTEFPEGVDEPFHHTYEKAMKEQRYMYLQEYYPPYDLWFENHIYPSPDGLSIFFRDITIRKNAEEKNERRSRLYSFISQVNNLIIYATDEKKLYKEICDAAVSAGEFQMCWVGIIDERSGLIMPVAHAGDETGYLQYLATTKALNLKEGTGPTSGAVREGLTRISNNIEKDPKMIPWRGAALDSGFQSSVAIPIKCNGKSIGALSLYAEQKDYFREDEVNLLEDVAKSISHLLDKFEHKKEKEKAAQELKESEAFSDSLIAASPDIIYIYNIAEGKNVYSNKEIANVLGYSKEEIKEMGNRVLAQLMHPDDFAFYLSHTYPRYATLKDKERCVHEYRMLDNSGNWHWINSKESVYSRDSKGNPVEIFGIATDITERKNREAVLIEKEHQLRLFVEYSPASIAMLDSTMRYVVVSKRWQIENGMEGKDVTGLSHYEVVPHIPDYWKDIHARCLGGASERKEEDVLVMPDGRLEWIKWEILPWYKASGVVGGIVIFSEIITERKRAELEILQSKNRLERAEEQALMGSWEFDVVRQKINWSKQMFRFFGLSDADTVPSTETYLGLIHPEDRATIQQVIEDMQAGKEKYTAFVYRTNPEKQPLRYLKPSWMVDKDEKGNVIRLSGTIIDVTSQVEAENTILKEKQISDRIINTLPGVFYLYNKEGKFLRWNEKFVSVTGYTDDEIRHMHPLMFKAQKDKEMLTQKIANVFESGEDFAEADLVTKSGEAIPYYFTGVTIEYEGENCLMGVGIDISERLKAQEEIKQSSELLRQLIAHQQIIREEERKRIAREIHDELGQQLTAVKMDVAWIDKKIPDDNENVKGKLKNIISLLDRSNLSIRKILNELRMGILDHYNIVEALKLQGQQFSEATGIKVIFDSDLSDLQASETVAVCLYRVYQEALTNIIRYASAHIVNTKFWQAEEKIFLQVTDDGKGFDEKILKSGNSFGILGMRERVASLQGIFELITAPGKGTRIKISLPFKANQ